MANFELLHFCEDGLPNISPSFGKELQFLVDLQVGCHWNA